jgi:hypothetical protein
MRVPVFQEKSINTFGFFNLEEWTGMEGATQLSPFLEMFSLNFSDAFF